MYGLMTEQRQNQEQACWEERTGLIQLLKDLLNTLIHKR